MQQKLRAGKGDGAVQSPAFVLREEEGWATRGKKPSSGRARGEGRRGRGGSKGREKRIGEEGERRWRGDGDGGARKTEVQYVHTVLGRQLNDQMAKTKAKLRV